MPAFNKTPKHLLAIAVITFLGIAIYSGSFHNSFHFDDDPFIVNNNNIKGLENIKKFFTADFNLHTRALTFLTFAINYKISKLNVFGFHIFNLFIHLINALLVYWLASLIIYLNNQLSLKPKSQGTSYFDFIPFFTALIFLTHPIQTQGVTYICQRFASLAALFYYLSICLYVKWRLEKVNKLKKLGYLAVSSICGILGMFTKETIFTLPLAVIMLETLFFHRENIKIKTKNAWPLAIIFIVLTSIIPALYKFDINTVLNMSTSSDSHAGDIVSFNNYWPTQMRVICRYLSLLYLPINQTLDYDFPLSKNIIEPATFSSFLLILSIILFSLYKAKRDKVITFSILFFFIALLVESSFIPIRNVIFEHRLYLPMFGFALLSAWIIDKSLTKNFSKYLILLTIITTFSLLAYQRNKVWKNEISLWQDVIRKSPFKERGYINLGTAYIGLKDYYRAIDLIDSAIAKFPKSEKLINNRGLAYLSLGKFSEAEKDFRKATLLNPSYSNPLVNMGLMYYQIKDYSRALEAFSKALQIEPYNYAILSNRGGIFMDLNRLPE
ncbi:MAG: tetratricopeptide repeat protein, partial [Candidatus Omnitrophica bacterium]|nr:tetratricopeptide repeat protein [Candidatus Omnitrophota bacterium]